MIKTSNCSNNTFSFNHVINESNSILPNNLVNKQIKERDEFNVLYLGKDINSELKNLLNDICSNKGLVKELQYSIEEINLKENKAIDILDNKKCLLMLSNSDPKNTNEEDNFFDDIYKGFEIERVFAKRMINCQLFVRT